MTTSFDPVAALKAYHAAIEARDLKCIGSALAENAIYHSNGLGPVNGRDAILAAMEKYFTRYPDHNAFDTRVAADGPLVAVSEWQLRATDSNTGMAIKRSGTERLSFNTNGSITSVDVEDLIPKVIAIDRREPSHVIRLKLLLRVD